MAVSFFSFGCATIAPGGGGLFGRAAAAGQTSHTGPATVSARPLSQNEIAAPGSNNGAEAAYTFASAQRDIPTFPVDNALSEENIPSDSDAAAAREKLLNSQPLTAKERRAQQKAERQAAKEAKKNTNATLIATVPAEPVQESELSRFLPDEQALLELAEKAAEEAAKEIEEEAIVVKPREIPQWSFSSLEMEHAKFSYYDPFGSGNQFLVNLDEEEFCYPLEGKFLSGYGYRGRSMHTGIDIKGNKGDTIRAAFAGTVRLSKLYSSYGNCIVLRHDNGLETLYSHNSKNLVKVGDRVEAGEPIALVGRTGRATTEHLHFEVRIQGETVNPALLVDPNYYSLRKGALAVTKNNGKILASNTSISSPTRTAQADPGGVTAERPAGTTPASAVASTAPVSTASSSASVTTTTHTVTRGDTLWAIAKKYKTTVAKLCDLNQIDSRTTLQLGKTLRIR